MLTKWSIQEFMTSCSYDDGRVEIVGIFIISVSENMFPTGLVR